MAKRLIDAIALMKQMDELITALATDYGQYDAYVNGLEEAKVAVEKTPTVDAVEEVHGKWIIGTGENALERGYRMCSVCGEIIKTQYSLFGMFNYCHYCGAEMDGGNIKSLE